MFKLNCRLREYKDIDEKQGYIDTIIYLVLIITSLIFIYAGSFLFEEGSFIGTEGITGQ